MATSPFPDSVLNYPKDRSPGIVPSSDYTLPPEPTLPPTGSFLPEIDGIASFHSTSMPTFECLDGALDLTESSFFNYPLEQLPTLPASDSVLNRSEDRAAKQIYSVILAAEAAAYTAAEKAPGDKDSKVNLIYARVIGCILLYPPGITARDLVVRQIKYHRGQTDFEEALYASIYDFGKFCTFAFIAQFRKWGDPHSDSFQNYMSETFAEKTENPNNCWSQVSMRDGYRCVVTSFIDLYALIKNKTAMDTAVRNEGQESRTAEIVTTTCGRIFDLFTSHVSGGLSFDARKHYVDAFTSIMKQFGYAGLVNRLTSDDCQCINTPQNLMTLSANVESLFRGMYLWFEEIPDEPDTYSVVCLDEGIYGRSIPRKVTLTSNKADVPLPDPEYLYIHAAACRIAKFSGVATYFLYCFVDAEGETILAEDSIVAHIRNYHLVSLT